MPATRTNRSQKARRFRLNQQARTWLQSPACGETGEGADWQAWIIGRMAAGAMIDVGGVLVDRAVLEQRFCCIPEKCAPRRGRGRLRSCCADVAVALTETERRRLERQSRRLGPWLLSREDRLPDFDWLSEDGGHLQRPGRRCVFSALDARGRIRCHLHRCARELGLERHAVQPLPCRLFPLILLDLDRRVGLTTIYRRTSRLVGTHPASRFPCLNDKSHPPLIKTLSRDLDWLFGKGFARALRSAAKT